MRAAGDAEQPHTASGQAPGWLHTQLRPFLMMLLTVAVVYLAATGVAEAKTALISGFTVILGALWGERAALKIPGKDT